jgi:hypothetical protein
MKRALDPFVELTVADRRDPGWPLGRLPRSSRAGVAASSFLAAEVRLV